MRASGRNPFVRSVGPERARKREIDREGEETRGKERERTSEIEKE